MVKGNSTVKNNKSVSFQPYDASNVSLSSAATLGAKHLPYLVEN